MPESRRNLRIFKILYEEYDGKRYTIGVEQGKGGYKHYQLRFTISGDADKFFLSCKEGLPELHLDKAQSETSDYERKDGYYWSSDDTNAVRSVRFGEPTNRQRHWGNLLKKQGDRSILVLYDKDGGHGKSWWAIHLREKRLSYNIDVLEASNTMIIRDICDGYNGEPYLIVDIPRGHPWTQNLSNVLEKVKDGLISDPRYSHKERNIRGVKIAVCTNEKPPLKTLSADRWQIIDVGEGRNP